MKVKFYYAPDEGSGSPGGGTDDTQNDEGVQPPEGTGSGTGDDQDLIPRTELSKVNREAARYRRERNEANARLKEIEDRDKSELEKAQAQLTTTTDKLMKMESQNRDLRVRVLAEVVGIAPAARADASKLLDWSKIEDPDDDAILEEALKELVKARPYLRGSTSGADGGAGGDSTKVGAGMNEAIRRAAGRR